MKTGTKTRFRLTIILVGIFFTLIGIYIGLIVFTDFSISDLFPPDTSLKCKYWTEKGIWRKCIRLPEASSSKDFPFRIDKIEKPQEPPEIREIQKRVNEIVERRFELFDRLNEMDPKLANGTVAIGDFLEINAIHTELDATTKEIGKINSLTHSISLRYSEDYPKLYEANEILEILDLGIIHTVDEMNGALHLKFESKEHYQEYAEMIEKLIDVPYYIEYTK